MSMEQEKIVVVDDEEAVRNLLKRILEGAGYRVTTAANGQEALYLLSLEEAKVILLDIKMPVMTGIEVLSKLNAEWLDFCAIMISAVSDIQTAVDTLKLGAYDYITKPFDQDEVKVKVGKAIKKYHRLMAEKNRYNELQKAITGKMKLMQEQFSELVSSLSREHKLLFQLAAKQADGGKAMLSKLPNELRSPSLP